MERSLSYLERGEDYDDDEDENYDYDGGGDDNFDKGGEKDSYDYFKDVSTNLVRVPPLPEPRLARRWRSPGISSCFLRS